MRAPPPIVLDDDGIAAVDVVAVAREGRDVVLGDRAVAAIRRGAAVLAALAAGEAPVYGVTTGFGALANTVIPGDRLAELQLALVRSHAAGMGTPVEAEVVRAMVLLRARSLAMGYAGVRLEVVEAMCGLLNAGLTPVVDEHGSLGASGDLAPLAAVALALLGEGEVDTPDGRVPAGRALADAGLAPLALGPKEGLALINGTDGMLGMLVLALADLRDLYAVADVVAAMSAEALLGTDRAFAADLVAMRPHPGQQVSAANLRALLDGSPLVASHRAHPGRVQDAYSIRCTPQVHGAGRDLLDVAAGIADRELVSFVDNPVVLPDARVASCGNFHGAPVAYAADLLAIPAADLAALSERRTDRLLDPARSSGLPPFLSPDAGVNSGLMIAQYTQAAMVAETRRLASPASVDTLSTSAGQEDHVSMGWSACRKLRTAVADVRRVLAVELLAAAHAIALRAPLRAAAATGAVAERVVDVAGGPGPDRHLAPRLAAVEALVADGTALATARRHVEGR
ncbi:histidine ammonia-lyase [Euzebya sp.]|uniref:histidine ammonia-lyase n=1 Tax=Euzebya sp. TaxID=1971409 RepID=UPI003517A46A